MMISIVGIVIAEEITLTNGSSSTNISSNITEEVKCTDSDGGVNPTEKGIVKRYEIKGATEMSSMTDYCGFVDEEKGKLKEFYCNLDNTYFYKLMDCKEGYICKEGACKREELKDESAKELIESTTDITIGVDSTTFENFEEITLTSETPSISSLTGGYTIELVSASDDSTINVNVTGSDLATIKVTDSSGNSESKELSMDLTGLTKIINGVSITLLSVDKTQSVTNNSEGFSVKIRYSIPNEKSLETFNIEEILLTSEIPSISTIQGEHTIELISATDDLATIKVTDNKGNFEEKEIKENDVKTVNGVVISVISSEGTDEKFSAKIKFKEIATTSATTDFVVPEKPTTIKEGEKCGACLNEENICVPFGIRTKGNYCDLTQKLLPQKADNEACENNYECSSNVCVNSKCISSGLIQKILNWFNKMFGGE